MFLVEIIFHCPPLASFDLDQKLPQTFVGPFTWQRGRDISRACEGRFWPSAVLGGHVGRADECPLSGSKLTCCDARRCMLQRKRLSGFDPACDGAVLNDLHDKSGIHPKAE
jgi:hypothetical protein